MKAVDAWGDVSVAAAGQLLPYRHERHGGIGQDLPASGSAGSPPRKTLEVPRDCSIRCQDLGFSYEAGREILKGVDLSFPMGSFTAIVGESGCGKSTIASILMGRSRGYTGTVTVGGIPLSEISKESLMRNFTYISHQSYLFKGTVRDNLLIRPCHAFWLRRPVYPGRGGL